MPDEIKPIQTETVSTETESKAETGDKTPEPAKQPSLEEIRSELAKSMDEKIAQITTSFKREMQSTKDKSVAEVERARRQAEETLRAIQSMAGDDPDLQARIQVAAYQAQSRTAQQAQSEEAVRRNADEFSQKYQDKVVKILKRFDVDPTDKRIDWAENETDRLERLDKITESAEKIFRSNLKANEEKSKKELAKIKQELGIDSVDTSAPTGSTNDGIPTNRTALRKWLMDVPDADYKRLKPKIDEMIVSGRIK